MCMQLPSEFVSRDLWNKPLLRLWFDAFTHSLHYKDRKLKTNSGWNTKAQELEAQWPTAHQITLLSGTFRSHFFNRDSVSYTVCQILFQGQEIRQWVKWAEGLSLRSLHFNGRDRKTSKYWITCETGSLQTFSQGSPSWVPRGDWFQDGP